MQLTTFDLAWGKSFKKKYVYESQKEEHEIISGLVNLLQSQYPDYLISVEITLDVFIFRHRHSQKIHSLHIGVILPAFTERFDSPPLGVFCQKAVVDLIGLPRKLKKD